MPSVNVKYLRENGPSTHDELPGGKVSVNDRSNGVWKVDVKGRARGGGSGEPTRGRLTPVYYLRDDHDPEVVIGKWAEVNSDYVEDASRNSVRSRLRRVGSEFHDAIDAVLPARGSHP